MKECQNGACKNCHNGTDECYLYGKTMKNNWKETFENEIESLKKEVGEIPENTCPNIDKLIKEHELVWQELEFLDRNAHRYESAEDLVKYFPSRGWTNTVEDIAEQLRKDNEQLRNLGKFWYESYKNIGGFIESLLEEQKKELIEEILSKAPEDNSIYEIDRLIDNNEKYIAGKLVGFNEANEQWRNLLKNHD